MIGIRKAAAAAALSIASLSSDAAQTPTRFIGNLEAGKPQVLVAFGTSLTAGGAWVKLTRDYLQAKYPGLAAVYNEGASGHSSKYALTIIHNVTRHKPDLALIEFAMNDAYYPEQNGYTEGVPPDTSKINLGIIIDSIKAVNPACEIILQTMDVPIGIHRQRRPDVLTYYQGYRDVAKERGLPLIDHERRWAALLAFDTSAYVSWLPDSIHPDSEGSRAITFPAVMGKLLGDSVSLDAPLDGAKLAAGDQALKATATGAGTAAVGFFSLKTSLGSDAAAPFSLAWKPAAGRYLLMAKRMDAATPIAISDLVTVTVAPATALRGPGARGNLQATPSRVRPPGFWLGRRFSGP